MTQINEQEVMQGVAERFAKAAEELRLSGAQLYREGIVTNDQVLSKIKNGWQKPTKKAIDLFCQKYDVSAAWLYTGEGNMFLGRNKPFGPRIESADEKLLYNTDFDSCLDSNGQPISTGKETPVSFPMAGDFDFMCINTDKSLAPFIMPADIIALKRLSSWKEYIPGDFICVVVTSEYKVLRKVSVTQPDEQSINFTQMVDGTPVESSIPKDIIVEIYKVVGNYRRQ
jgi:hypothetical protein